jgi:hypothetical protein
VNEIFNIHAIFVTMTLSLRVGAEVCEGQVHIGPFQSKDAAREWIPDFGAQVDSYWKGRRFEHWSESRPVVTLKEELEKGFRYSTSVELKVISRSIDGVPRKRSKLFYRFALNPVGVSTEQLVARIPAVLVRNVSLTLLRLFPLTS